MFWRYIAYNDCIEYLDVPLILEILDEHVLQSAPFLGPIIGASEGWEITLNTSKLNARNAAYRFQDVIVTSRSCNTQYYKLVWLCLGLLHFCFKSNMTFFKK